VSCRWSTPQKKTENTPAALIDSVRSVVQSRAHTSKADPLGALSPMLAYHFTLRKDGARVDDLGFMALVDDGAALVFGTQVIRDLMRGDRNYSGWIMDITEGKRLVGNIPFQ
jgi:hypothetical protein